MARKDHQRTTACFGLIVFLTIAIISCQEDGPTGPPDLNLHNGLLNGPWLFFQDDYPNSASTYFLFDGEGTVVEGGGHGAGSPLGTYSMNEDSSGTIVINFTHDPTSRVSG